MAQNALSNLAKREVAYSGQADVGDVPELYALRDAMAAERAADMGGTPGLGAGSGGVVPLPTAAGGGGSLVGGAADTGLPGAGFENPEIERLYTQAFRSTPNFADGADRGEIASRGAINYDPADPFGLGFGQNMDLATQIAGLLGIPGMGMANAFINLMMQDASLRSDAFFEGLIQGTAPVDPYSGVTIDRSGGPTDFDVGLATGDIGISPDSGVSISRGDSSGDIGAGMGGSPTGGGAATSGGAPSSGSAGVGSGVGGAPGGDAGSGGGGGDSGGGDSGGGGMGCFVEGTSILMADGSSKNIEDIKLGDVVTAFDADSGETDGREVISLFAHAAQPIWALNDRTFCTPGHRFFANFGGNGWGFWPLEEIPIGARLMSADGSEIVAETIQDTGRRQTVRNFTVQGLHTYIANGYRVHNIKHMGGYISESRVPGQRRGDVAETLQEGEYVLTADAVDMLGGPAFFDGMNTMARLARRK